MWSNGFGSFEFNSLTSVPVPENSALAAGITGAYAGLSNEVLIIAGGMRTRPDDAQKQHYLDDIYIYNNAIDTSHPRWNRQSLKLPEKMAFGTAITTDNGVILIGGRNHDHPLNRVMRLEWNPDSAKVEFEPYPPLPRPLAHCAAGLLDNRIYVAGGKTRLTGTDTTRYFYTLDLRQEGSPDFAWQSMPSWPGPPRIDPVVAVQSNGETDCLYVFGGKNDSVLLQEGFEYNPDQNSWKNLSETSDLNFPVSANAAFRAGTNSIVFAGCMQSKNPDSTAQQPVFPNKEILVYNTVTRTLTPFGELPFPSQSHSAVIHLDDGIILAGGIEASGNSTKTVHKITISENRRTFGVPNTIVLAGYFAILIFIGWYFARRQKSTDDFFKGGGRVPWWAAGLSIFGTVLSAITFMAIPAKTYATDWSYFMFNMGIIMVAPLVILWFIPFYRKLNITTAYEFLEIRFNLATRLLGSLSFILFQIGRMGIVLFLPSIALSVVTGIPIIACILVMGIFSMIYTSIGGIEAVIWTDVIQVIVLLGGALLSLVIIALNVQNGLPGMIEVGIEQDKFNIFNTVFDLKQPYLWTVLVASLFTNLTTYGTDQTIVQRYLTVKDQRAASNSVWTNAILSVPASLLFFMMGTALFVFYRQHPTETSLAIQEADAIFPWYIMTQLPRGVSGLLIAGVFAAAMSSLSSSINSAATAYITDFHQRFGWGQQQHSLRAAKRASVIIGIVGTLFAVFMASWDIKSLWDEFNKILGLVLGGLGGVFLLGVLSRRASGIGALGGILISAIVQYFVALYQPVHLLLYTGTGVITCFISGQVISLFFPNKNQKRPGNS
jgi:SSS family transporter